MTLKEHLVEAEGLREKPYMDCCGRYWRLCDCIIKGKLTIGVGRNLDDVGISPREAMILLDDDIARSQVDLDQYLPWWRTLDPIRQEALIELCFNMGIGNHNKGLRSFRNTLKAMQVGNWEAVAHGLRTSKWAQDVKRTRTERIVNMFLQGGGSHDSPGRNV